MMSRLPALTALPHFRPLLHGLGVGAAVFLALSGPAQAKSSGLFDIIRATPDSLVHSPPSRTLGNAVNAKRSAAEGAKVQLSSTLRTHAPSPHLSSQAPLLTAQAPTVGTTDTPIPPSDIHAAFDIILAKYVSAPDEHGLTHFDYATFKATDRDYTTLTAYIDRLSRLDPDAFTPDEAVAYWANLYNAVTLKIVTRHYPVSSIREIKSGLFTPGPWKKKLITVNGTALSLDNIEHDILRKKYPSPLIHYMVNCASIGCPNLRSHAWRAQTYEQDRKDAARAFINSPRGHAMTDRGLTVSSIYKWFEDDFGGSKTAVLDHLRTYADPDLATAIEAGLQINDYAYDWALNDYIQSE